MTRLSQRTLITVRRAYRKAYGLHARPVMPSGHFHKADGGPRRSLARIPAMVQTRAYALQEAVHWGEPYVFSLAPAVVSWIVPLVDGDAVRGGLYGGEVVPRHCAGSATESAGRLAQMGMADAEAKAFVQALPVWPREKLRKAALFLHEIFYQVSGWRPALLHENSTKAQQQRQIAAAVEAQKQRGQTGYPVAKERVLLTLIRAGDRNGARRVLNEMLGVMFAASSRLVILRARAIELLGYLTRAAVEDSPLLEPLIERNHVWTEQLIKASDFETLAHTLMRALDDFMERIYVQGFNCYNAKVGEILDVIQQCYAEPVSLKSIAKQVGLSPSRVGHLVKDSTGKTVGQHIMQLRIRKAQQLLQRTTRDCAQIGGDVGFCDQSYFTKHFRRLTGTTPARYRRGRISPAG